MAVNIPRFYRQMLRTIRLVPVESERAAYLQEARDSFKKNKSMSSEEASTALGLAVSKLSFLHIKHPVTKQACPTELPEGLELAASRSGAGVSRKYYYNGEEVSEGAKGESKAKNYRNWVDPDDIKHHHKLVERQHFGGDFWKGKY
mmetsp:Transcript_1124/g.1926  ORF Transcript_1124/g.1926 Transcript_1124/m.1926 type:complete len:146 (+) Transcript_1124:92-529(+)|eukprot:CAMPEP_0197524652 /NCGR_PEP_ID=MMETSP1318-20131121/9261_1 /TAXON_ID=552666 /ORGANISM="Partenskyella glossopodia, Strain RCC365" /LENGTH=145 /DNA_ID=CAMNT_0043077641 /DNA_START=80 /DNA_END=517 /DNA_ORIENTATION=+